VKNGDEIRIDASARSIDLMVAARELKRRQRDLKPRRDPVNRGVLAKYARQVGSAAYGAITDG
jgi:dihydroxy-acid dehydratase